MSRYIDADAFKDFMDMTCDAGGLMYPVVKEIKEYVKKQIDGQPTANVRENKYGKWHILDECSNEGVYCNVCHKKVFKYDFSNTMKWTNFNFCPNCGADMKGETNG